MDNSRISKHLGQKSEYKAEYDNSLLVREPRAGNRTHLQLDDDNLPFVGYDTWNNYEISGLAYNGVPVSGVAKIIYPATNKYIVESKSLKLYFGSFHMTKLGETPDQVRAAIAKVASQDLSNLLETDVKVNCWSDTELSVKGESPKVAWNYQDFLTLEDVLDLSKLDINTYIETPSLLELREETEIPTTTKFHSSLLRSRCRVTAQPDSGDIFITVKGKKQVTPESLLKYIISFRDECHFHEEICEAVYKRLYDLLSPDELVVRCLYARRGSIDINPERASSAHLLTGNLYDVSVPYTKTPRQ